MQCPPVPASVRGVLIVRISLDGDFEALLVSAELRIRI